MSWNDLSMKDKTSYIRMGVENGITDLDTIREVYNKFAEGGPIKKSYKDFSTRLSKAWNNENLSKHDYDYQKYYNDDPDRAYRQLISIEKGGHGHFPDEGRSGTYKTPKHPTYPDLGSNSWLNNGRIFNMSARQAVPENTDRILDYLGSDLDYNRGATRVMYNGAYQLPEVTATPNGNYTELVPNELNTGWMYIDRAGRFDDVNYSYLDGYLGNKKSLGGNLYGNGGYNTPPLEYDLSKTVKVSPKQQAERLVSLGNGVYKDKISGKLLYNYDEMPTAEVTGHKKEKSVNDNWQAAYAKGIHSGTMSADMETMNAVTGGAMNLISPSQVIGAAIHSDKSQDYILNLLKRNNGIVTDNFAQEHPYLSVGANVLFDAATLGLITGGKTIGNKFLNSDLRYELDPRYMKVYHHSPKPFDIDNFNIATKKDAGLHVSPYPDYNSIFGDVIYKGYTKKPSFEFLDVGSNGFGMFTPTSRNLKTAFKKSPLTKRYLKSAYSPKSLNELEFTSLKDKGWEDVSNKYAKKYVAPKNEVFPDKSVDSIELIFPKESSSFKESLRELSNQGIYIDPLKGPSVKNMSTNEVYKHNLDVNKKIADFLSSHKYPVGEYTNMNSSEKFPQSFSIFDRNAAHNWKRIK